MLRKLGAMVLVLLTLWGAAGCASGKSSASLDKDTAANGKGPQEEAGSGAAGESFDIETGAVQNRKLIKNVELEIQTKTYDVFMESLNSSLAAQEGYVQQSDMQGNGERQGGRRSATIVVRVPADRLDEFLKGISSEGVVTSRSENVQDVTTEYVDIESRLAALRTEQTSLLALLEKAGSLQDILTIQDRLTEVRGEIESYEAKLRMMQTLVANSTVTIRVYEVEKEPDAQQKGMWQEIGEGFMNSLKAVGHGLRVFFIWFMSSLPYLLVAAVIIGIVLLIVRIALVRSRKKQARFVPYGSSIPTPRVTGSPQADDPARPENKQN